MKNADFARLPCKKFSVYFVFALPSGQIRDWNVLNGKNVPLLEVFWGGQDDLWAGKKLLSREFCTVNVKFRPTPKDH